MHFAFNQSQKIKNYICVNPLEFQKIEISIPNNISQYSIDGLFNFLKLNIIKQYNDNDHNCFIIDNELCYGTFYYWFYYLCE